MKKLCYSLVLILVLGLYAAPALADSFGDKIAQQLCFTRAESMVLSESESAQYDATAEIDGQYQTEKNGVVVTANFIKRTKSAICKKSDCPVGGGDCPVTAWPIAKEGNMLKRTFFSGTE